MTATSVVGLDIGGANLKAATWSAGQVRAVSLNFPMWKQPHKLTDGVHELLSQLGQQPSHCRLAVTMTGELADCFANRSEGVSRILQALAAVVPTTQISVYRVDGSWSSAEQARADPWSVAASNWHALASWLVAWPLTASALEYGVLVDIGSTTVDVLPIVDGRLITHAQTDRQRLEQGQLVYTGLRRTPVCAIVSSLVIDAQTVPVMAELFATVDDAYVYLGLVAEDEDDSDTADGRPRTKELAANRLARMIGEDACRMTRQQLASLSEQIIDAQASLVGKAIDHNLNLLAPRDDLPSLICCGHGLPLFERTIRKVESAYRLNHVSQFVSHDVSRCAPAAAVAWLWQNHSPA